MNEKIKELVERSYGTIQFDGDYHYYDEHFSIEKFAELIIKECLKVAEDTIDDGDATCCTNMADFITRNIKYHFGVKE